MKKLILVGILGLLISCNRPAMYRTGTCFTENFIVVEIEKVTKTHYELNFHVPFMGLQKRQFKHHVFEEEISKKGLIGISCEKLNKEEK